MSKTEELLKVLDLPEEEQWKWAVTNLADADPEYENDWRFPPKYKGKAIHTLADLAFRLRDEVWTSTVPFKATYFERGLWITQHRETDSEKIDLRGIDWKWWVREARPIDWIIAALIAKHKEAEDG